MIDEVPRVSIGPFTKGEIPPALENTFVDEDGTEISLNGCTAAFVISCLTEEGVLGLGAGDATIVSGGKTKYEWTEDDMATAGFYRGQMWVGDGQGGKRFASNLFEWWVQDATPVPGGL